MERKKDFSIERILSERWNGPSLTEENSRTDLDLQSTVCRNKRIGSSSSSCEEDEDDFRNIPSVESLETGSAGSFRPSDTIPSASWLHTSNYVCTPFFNRGWLSQAIRPPFFTLQGNFLFKIKFNRCVIIPLLKCNHLPDDST